MSVAGCREEQQGSWRWGIGPRRGPCTTAKVFSLHVLVMGSGLKAPQMGLWPLLRFRYEGDDSPGHVDNGWSRRQEGQGGVVI